MFHLITMKFFTSISEFTSALNSAVLDALKLYLIIKNNLKVLSKEMKTNVA